jgi:hypothetical protein
MVPWRDHLLLQMLMSPPFAHPNLILMSLLSVSAIKQAKRAEKQKAHEQENLCLLKDDVEKKKAEGKSEGRSKRKHDPSAVASKGKSAPKKKKAEPADEFEMNDSSDDDPPLTKDEVVATLSEQVNITTSTVLPDLWVPMVPEAPPKKITARKTPATTVTMKQHVNTTPHPDAINLKDLVVDTPVSTAKPGERIPKPDLKKIKVPTTKHNAPQATAPNEKAANFAPTLTQPLASKPPSGDESDNSKWIMEWMAEGKRIKCTTTDFLSHFHFPRFEHGDTLKFGCTTLMSYQMKPFDA